MANVGNPGKKIRITRSERKSGQIDKSKIPATKTKVVAMNKPEKDTPAQMKFSHGSTKKVYVKKDVRTGDPSYGKESKTNPTPEFVKKAQRAGAETAEKGGKAYAAGENKSVKTTDKHHVKIKVTPVMNMHIPHAKKPSETGAGKDNIKQSFGKGPRRRMERVAWLKGRNKRTETGFGNK
jgi:hypothetical protein